MKAWQASSSCPNAVAIIITTGILCSQTNIQAPRYQVARSQASHMDVYNNAS